MRIAGVRIAFLQQLEIGVGQGNARRRVRSWSTTSGALLLRTTAENSGRYASAPSTESQNSATSYAWRPVSLFNGFFQSLQLE
jgi:hypothetical protein